MTKTLKQHRMASLMVLATILTLIMAGVDFGIAKLAPEYVAATIPFNLVYSFLFLKPVVFKFDNWLRKD